MADIKGKPLVLTAGIVREFFNSVGVVRETNCPKCGNSNYGHDEDPDDYIYTTYERDYIDEVLSEERVQDKNFGIYYLNCDNCGYFEEYYMTPLVRDWLSKNG